MQRIFIIILIVVVFLAFMVTYTVRFTEKAIITTFGRADASSVRDKPGLGFKIPYVQTVTKYDTRARFLESPQETQQTQDNSSLLVKAYMTWRVDDPLTFYKKFSHTGDSPRDHYKAAEATLQSKLRSAMGEVSRYKFTELLGSGAAGSKLPELEKRILENLRADAGKAGPGQVTGSLSDFGVTAVTVGISRIGLPAANTKSVFDRMSQEREKIANAAIDQGKSIAESLRSGADTDAAKITNFAERLASSIRQQGDIEASEWLKQMNSDPQLAVFLNEVDFLRQVSGSRTTFVLPTTTPGLNLARPDALKNLKAGEIPAVDMSGVRAAALGESADEGTAVPARKPGTPAAPAQGERR